MPVLTDKDIKEKIRRGRNIIINSDKVYDVTDFVDKHPGGKEYLQTNTGEDVTGLMQNLSPHQHSGAAYSILNKYLIGNYSHSSTENGLKHRSVNGTTSNGEVLKENGVNETIFQDLDKDDLVDWSKPIFWQVPYIGERYFEWVHQPVDKPIRLFYSDFCEFFSVCKWWIVPIFWTPVMFALLWLSYLKLSEDPVTWPASESGITFTANHIPVLFAVGVIFWTFDEYAIHRWLFHMRPPHQYPILILLHFILHGQHHKSPMDKGRLVFPTVPAVCLAIVFYSLYSAIFGTALALSLFAGTVGGYMAYDLVHYYLHHGVPYGSYFKSLKKYHVKHHYKNQQLGFGISSKLWDYPFGTVLPE